MFTTASSTPHTLRISLSLAALLSLQVAVALLSSVSASCQKAISCPCGSTGEEYKFCNDDFLETEKACRTWSRCFRCQDEVDHCLECPVGLTGPTCSESSPDYDLMYCGNPGTFHYGRINVLLSPDEHRSGVPRDEGAGTPQDDEYPQGTRLRYTCEKGYVMRGEAVITCEDTGFWSAEPPICVSDCGRSAVQTSYYVNHQTAMHDTSYPFVPLQRTRVGEWPWTVAVATTENNHTRVICQGALFNRRTVLTAAHCVDLFDNIQLYFGKYYRRMKDDDGRVVSRRRVIVKIHPHYKRDTLESDIALIRFFPRIRFSDRIQPVCLPNVQSTTRNVVRGNIGFATTWGLNERSVAVNELMMSHVPVIPFHLCIREYRARNLSLPKMPNVFCGGFERWGTSICIGSSGSPLVFYDRMQGRYTLEGLVSFGSIQCGSPGSSIVLTKVLPHMPWILNNMS